MRRERAGAASEETGSDWLAPERGVWPVSVEQARKTRIETRGEPPALLIITGPIRELTVAPV